MRSVRGLALVLAVMATGAVAPAWCLDCLALQLRRDALMREAFQEEVAVLQRLRLQLCPLQEQAAGADLDYATYVRCRHQAEARLERARPILYRNRLGFTYYTPVGARLARDADALDALPCSQASTPR